MIKSLIGSTALSLCLLAGAATAEISHAQWGEVRDFLERNPNVMEQVTTLMDRELKPDQVDLDAAFVAENATAIFDAPLSPVLGNADGEVTVVKFSDYRCPHCRNVTPELKKLIDADPRVKLIIKEFPVLGPESVDMARFALAANKIGGTEAFQAAQDMLFASNQTMSLSLIKGMAAELQLDEEAMIKAMTSPEVEAELIETQRLAAGLKINGTPGLILKDFVIRGAIPYDTMVIGIDEFYPDPSEQPEQAE
ncbi:DsbA family protein [Pseudosulfitobacter pseudonitzschiae]|uniref:DsbA family protein n=1 Tax=Pseudosulfitobacter pseudonitzschiae TaxID=1402135 RepID=UPI003B9FDBAF